MVIRVEVRECNVGRHVVWLGIGEGEVDDLEYNGSQSHFRHKYTFVSTTKRSANSRIMRMVWLTRDQFQHSSQAGAMIDE